MRKLSLFMLMAVGLLISGNAGAIERTAGTIAELSSALTAASDGDVIKLTSDITSSTTINVVQKAITLDLNGYNLTYTGSGSSAYDALYVSPGSGKTVTIDGYNDAKTKKGTIERVNATSNGDVIYFGSGSLVIDGCNISAPNKSTMTYVLYCKGASISVSNTTISGGRFALGNIASPSITIGENVTIENNYTYQLYLYAGASVSMSSPLTKVCTDGVTSSFTINSGLSVSTSTWALSGATTFNNNGTLEIATACGSYAMNINNTGTCSITAGSFKKNVAIDNTGTLTISGGEFSADLTLGASQSCIVTGGTFAVGTEDAPLAYDRIAGFIQSGYKAVSSVIGSTPAMAVVDDSYVGEATYNNTDYATLSAAVAAALANTEDNNPIVTLKKDVTLSSTLTISGTLTLNMGAFSITGGSYGYIKLTGGDVTIQGSGSIQSESNNGVIYTSSKTANLELKGSLQIAGSKYGIHDYSGIKNLIIANTVSITGTTTDIYVEDYCENIVNHSNANIVCTSTYVYIGNITSDGEGTILIQSGCKISAASYENLKDYIESGYKGFLQKDATYGDIYLVAAETQTVAAKIGDYEYLTLNAAYSAAVAGDEIDLVADFSTSSYFTIKKQITIDLNGHSFKVGQNGILVYCDITIIDSSEGHTGRMYNEDAGYYLFQNYTNNTTIKLLGGTFQELGAMDEDWESYAVTTKSQATYTLIVDGPHTKIEVPYGTGIAVYGRYESSTVTIRNGASITAGNFCIANLGTYTDMNTTMNIESGAQLTSTEGPAIYHPGGGYLNISGENTVISGAESGIEIRAGVLNMTGGKVVSTYVGSESESWGNGNGTTTIGAGIAVAQHTTKLPVTVNISGGDIDALIPVKLANPQNNSEEDINKVSVVIEGGRYKVVNGAGAPFWSITDNFAVSAGKFSHVPAYVVAGKTVVPNTGGDKDIYPWTIGEVNETPITPTGDITWQNKEQWPDGKVPTSQDQVTLTTSQNIVVSGSSDDVAQAYGITIPTGSTITVESGATLVIGGGGITNEGGEANINGLKVEPGAQVIVSPDADMTGLYGRVALKPNVGKYPANLVGEFVNKPNRYQLVGIPTKDAPDAITKNKDDGDGFKLNQWDVETGWKAASLSDFSVPFKGFFFWNDVDLTLNTADDDESRVTYYFKGELFGNKPQTLVFTEHEGFHLFANSYLAEVDIMALIQGAENKVQKAVYVYNPVEEKFTDISYATYGKPGVPSAIQPMQGFYFLNQKDETTQAPMDYVSMVWSNAFKVEQEFVPNSAPRKGTIDGSEVRVNITDNVVGRTDGVYVMENDKYSAELDGSDIQKMMNPATSVNIYAATTVGNLSTMQTNDVEYQYLTIETNAASMYTMSFDWVAGDELYLLDTYTNQTTLMAEGNTYTFVAQPKSVITNRFQIVKTPAQVPTAVENVKSVKAVKGTYTVTGQCLGENVIFDKLPQGVYVIDGVKVVK